MLLYNLLKEKSSFKSHHYIIVVLQHLYFNNKTSSAHSSLYLRVTIWQFFFKNGIQNIFRPVFVLIRFPKGIA